MTAQTLRPHQQKMIDGIIAKVRAKETRILASLAAGGGKTTIFSEITRSAVHRGHKVAVAVHRKELMEQAVTRLQGQGVRVGLVGAGLDTDPEAPVQVISIQTHAARVRLGKPLPGPFRVGIIDECHHIAAATWTAFFEWLGDATVLGFSATPWQPNGAPLPFFTSLVEGPPPHELVGEGLPLCPVRIFAGPTPDLTTIAVRGGDFNQGQLGGAYKGLDGDIVECWSQHARSLRTICFATSIDQSVQLVKEWRARGVTAEHVDYETDKDVRSAIWERFRSGVTQVVSNVALICEGFDVPSTECVVLARATKSEALFVQMVGRGLRASPGKKTLLLLDHGRNCQRFGHPLASRTVSLTDWRRKQKHTEEELSHGLADGLRMCTACLVIVVPSLLCPNCGKQMQEPQMPKINKKVTLTEWATQELSRATTDEARVNLKRDFWFRQRDAALRKGKRFAWQAVHIYKASYGKMPHEDGILKADEIRGYWALLARRKRA